MGPRWQLGRISCNLKVILSSPTLSTKTLVFIGHVLAADVWLVVAEHFYKAGESKDDTTGTISKPGAAFFVARYSLYCMCLAAGMHLFCRLVIGVYCVIRNQHVGGRNAVGQGKSLIRFSVWDLYTCKSVGWDFENIPEI